VVVVCDGLECCEMGYSGPRRLKTEIGFSCCCSLHTFISTVSFVENTCTCPEAKDTHTHPDTPVMDRHGTPSFPENSATTENADDATSRTVTAPASLAIAATTRRTRGLVVLLGCQIMKD